MTIEITLPFGKKQGVKDIVFNILSKEYPLRIIDLMNFIKKRYGKSVTFQAVRKAVFELKDNGVLVQTENKFLINKNWILESKKALDELHVELNSKKVVPRKIDSLGDEVSVFSFESLDEMMKFWQEIIDNWYKHYKKGDYNINCYQAAHAWEALLHPDSEIKLMGQLKNKGIKSYILSTGYSPLDKYIKKFYKEINVELIINPSTSTFERGYYVGTYGNMIIQTQYPPELVKELDLFFKKNKSIDNLNLEELFRIVNKKISIKLTVIKDLSMAKQINKSILNEIKQKTL